MSFKNTFVHFLFILTFYLGSSEVYARNDLVPGSRYTAARGAALGDAYLPLGDDIPSGLFYNPAVLGKIRRATIEPFNMSLSGNSSYFSMMDSSSYNGASLSGFSPALQNSPGKMSNVGGAFIPSFGFPGFAFGVLIQSDFFAQGNGDSTITYQSKYQLVPAIGTGFRLFSGVIRFGYSLQWVNLATGGATVPVSDSIGFDQGLARGSGFSHTLGVALTLPIQYLPALNLVVRNALNTSYSSSTIIPIQSGSSEVPGTEPMTVDGSFSIHPRLGQGASLNLSIVQRDMTNKSGTAFIGHFALGGEFAFRNSFFLRGGWGGGYPSAGLGIKVQKAELSLAWFSEELGTGYLANRNIRYMFQYQIRPF
jgi:hypothetical protein